MIMDILEMPVDLADRRMLKEQVKAAPSGKPSLSFKEPAQALRDILDSVKSIEDFTAGMSFEDLREDDAPVLAADVPWRQIQDLGKPAAPRIR
jgi:hypothetical protein